MNKYLGTSLMMLQSFCIIGGPSVGKSSLMKMILLIDISLGLNGLLMTLMPEQAFQLGRIYMHKLLLLPVREKCTVQHLAELALSNIYLQIT
jgi:hypothetical protein